jgi:hypothetical protein
VAPLPNKLDFCRSDAGAIKVNLWANDAFLANELSKGFIILYF